MLAERISSFECTKKFSSEKSHISIVCSLVDFFWSLEEFSSIPGWKYRILWRLDWVMYSAVLRPFFIEHRRDKHIQWDILRFFQLTDKFCLPELIDEALDEYLWYYRDHSIQIPIYTVVEAYQTLLEGSPFRRVVLHDLIYVFHLPATSEGIELWPTSKILCAINQQPDLALDFL